MNSSDDEQDGEDMSSLAKRALENMERMTPEQRAQVQQMAAQALENMGPGALMQKSKSS